MSSERDKAILNSILNPFLPLGSDFATEDESSLKDDVQLTKTVIEAKKIERKAILLAENGRFQEALRDFTEAISIAPDLASLFNNRAQVYRLADDLDRALLDLNQAILLSNGQGKSGCQAFCQRGLIYRKSGEDEKAVEDFKKAAALGSNFAKMVLVQMNPYAALCNQMLSQVFEKLKNAS